MLEIDVLPEAVKSACAGENIDFDGLQLCLFCDKTPHQVKGECYLLADQTDLFILVGEQADGCWNLIGSDRYSLKKINRVWVEEQISSGILLGEIDGETVLLASFSNTCKAGAFLFCKYLKWVTDGKEIPEQAQSETPNARCCPKCGMRYPDPNRSVCPHCMEKDRLFRRIWVFLKQYKGYMVLIILSLLILTGMGILSPYLSSGFFFDKVISTDGEFYGKLKLVLGLMIGVKILDVLSSMLNNWVTSVVAAKMVFDLKKTIFSSIQRLSLGFFTGRQTGGLMTQVNQDANTIYEFFCDGVPYLIVNGVKVITVTVLLFLIQPVLAVSALLVVPVYLFVLRRFFRKEKNLHAKRFVTARQMSGFLADTFAGFRLVKVFSEEDSENRRFSEKNFAAAQSHQKLTLFNNYAWTFARMLLVFGNQLAWGFGGYIILSGRGNLTYGLLLTFVSYLNMVYSPLGFFTEMGDKTADCSNAMQRLFEIMDAQPEVVEKENALDPDSISGDVEFRDVCFSYVKGKRVIENVSFQVPEGGTLGIVGHTGAGKSTLANLLLRLYDVEEGEIRIGGYPIKDLKLEAVYRQIAIVSQETYLFMGTILDNIRYAKPEATYEEVVAAAHCSGAHDFIMRLPDAYHTKIGTGATELSGGEKQRLSIARAILKNPKILILDEATAAMDTKTERRIQEALDELTKGKTTIVIAHRLSTLRSADRLIVMEHGKMTEEGTHDELLRKENGTYRKLYDLQMEALKNAGICD